MQIRKKDSLTADLVAYFKRLISEGALAPGCKLPPERELAQRLEVSRTSLRQALKVLEIMGILSQRVGDGTYLNADSASILQESLDFLILIDGISQHELFEARLIVEPELAARAAERATSQDLAALKRAITDLEEGESFESRAQADLAFHEAIFNASGNRVCQSFFRVLHKMTLLAMVGISKRLSRDRPLQWHKEIYSAIFKRDPEEARRKMIGHLTDLQLIFQRPRAENVALIETLLPLKPGKGHTRSNSRHRTAGRAMPKL